LTNSRTPNRPLKHLVHPAQFELKSAAAKEKGEGGPVPVLFPCSSLSWTSRTADWTHMRIHDVFRPLFAVGKDAAGAKAKADYVQFGRRADGAWRFPASHFLPSPRSMSSGGLLSVRVCPNMSVLCKGVQLFILLIYDLVNLGGASHAPVGMWVGSSCRHAVLARRGELPNFARPV